MFFCVGLLFRFTFWKTAWELACTNQFWILFLCGGALVKFPWYLVTWLFISVARGGMLLHPAFYSVGLWSRERLLREDCLCSLVTIVSISLSFLGLDSATSPEVVRAEGMLIKIHIPKLYPGSCSWKICKWDQGSSC